MDKKTIYFPMNFGSGNRGCEAIVRGTSEILALDKSKTILYDLNQKELELDKFLEIDRIGELRCYANNSVGNYGKRGIHKALRKLKINVLSSGIYPYTKIIKEVNDDDIVLLTGGDLYCYESHLYKNTQFVKKLKEKKKTKIVLWGASVEKKLLTEDSIKGLKLLDKITARESLTYESLIDLGVSENIELYPDPAFVLNPVPAALPECLSQSDVVGINVSNLINGGFELNTDFSRNIIKLIDHILKETEFQILLIPHVTWRGQDDRMISQSIAERYNVTNRIHVLKMDRLSYQEIRYVISKCRLFMGGRTHSMISAYSTCVPAIALGYSIKSRGIAKDLKLPKDVVVDCKNLESDDILLKAFDYLLDNEKIIRNTLSNVMPDYKKRAYLAKNALEEIISF